MAKFPVATGLACAAAPLFVVPQVIGRGPAPAAPAWPIRAQRDGVRRRAEGVRLPAAAQSQASQAAGPAVSRKWRHRLLAAIGVATAWLWPKMAYARVAKRVVSRADERRAGLYTALAIGFFFVVAYFNSRKEDDSEEKRIKEEVKRLVRLKKEFEETEEQEELSDDNLSASLRAAQQKMDGEDEAAEGEAGAAGEAGEAGDAGAGEAGAGEKKETTPEEGAKDEKPEDDKKEDSESDKEK
mmetsp:Transcript_63280/g.100472  ORF Transcript_63280/g.100472 Transcript_63280/m.100472 type:complete len:241 (-) Transcript_63280:93-815(-)